MNIVNMAALFCIFAIAFVLVTVFDVEPTLEAMVVSVVSVIGFASVAVQGLVVMAKVTPNTKDDEMVGGLKKLLSHISGGLDLLAMNLSFRKARHTSKDSAIAKKIIKEFVENGKVRNELAKGRQQGASNHVKTAFRRKGDKS